MFYCNSCATENDWPDSIFKSYGRCEVCGKSAACSDVQAKYLKPLAKPQTPKKMVPDCEMGYTESQMREMLGTEQYKRFCSWMSGQTMGLCDGRKYSHEAKTYSPSKCKPTSEHGPNFYPWDVQRFLDRLPVID